jgi:hypothetical protein
MGQRMLADRGDPQFGLSQVVEKQRVCTYLTYGARVESGRCAKFLATVKQGLHELR